MEIFLNDTFSYKKICRIINLHKGYFSNYKCTIEYMGFGNDIKICHKIICDN